MIYTRMGAKARVVGHCGQHTPMLYRAPVTLLKLEWLDDETEKPTGKFRFYFQEFLKADGAWKEICDAAEAAPKIELKGEELKKAIKEAA